MIAFFIAAALALNVTPKVASTKPLAPAPTISLLGASEPPVLTGVAVTLECTARISGRVEACTVLDETHPGMGFGEAALALMIDAEVEPQRAEIQFAKTIIFTH